MVLKQFISGVFIFLFSLSSHAQNFNNVDFEATAPGSYNSANAVSGWTVSSQQSNSCSISNTWNAGSNEFSIVATPQFSIPNIGTLPTSPLGGLHVAKLNDFSGSSNSTKISHNYSVTVWDWLFQFSFASTAVSAHDCCDQAKFKIVVRDCAGNIIPSFGFEIIPASFGCQQNYNDLANSLLSYNGYLVWNNWATYYFDLSAYIGSCVTIEVISSDCTAGCDYCSLFFDARTSGSLVCMLPPGPIINQSNSVNFCTGSQNATIIAPLGYANYSWVGPSWPFYLSSSSSNTLTLSSAVANSVYTVNLTSYSGYTSSVTYTIASSSASIVSIGSSPTCPLLASGSASIIATGGDLNYTYAWYNALGQLVSTSQNPSGLATGDYSVTVTSVNNNCGSASATVAVGSTSVANTSYIIQPYCQNQSAYLSASPSGSNYQWYNNTNPIAANQGGNVANYTVLSGSNGAVYPLSYINTNGCKDSVRFYLNSINPSLLSVINNSAICQNSNNGVASVTLIPMDYTYGSAFTYSLYSMPGMTTFSSNAIPSPTMGYTFNNLQASIVYSLNVFDGLCKYSTTLTPNIYKLPFSIYAPTFTLCSSQPVTAQPAFSTYQPNAATFSYTWAPNIFLQGNVNNQPTAIITPTTPFGSVSTTVYTLQVSNPAYNCPASSNTVAITIALLPTPTISPAIPNLCLNSPAFTISANPPGGVFSATGQSGLTSNVITPAASALGVRSVTYTLLPAVCGNSVSKSYTVYPTSPIFLSGNNRICMNQTESLIATGADTYTWSTNSNSPLINVSPTTNTVYFVSGTFSNTSCSATASISIIVDPLPTVTIVGTKTICLGGSTTLTAMGADSYYSWSTGSSNSSIVVSPTETTNYIVSGGNTTQCTDVDLVTVTVIACASTSIGELNENESLIIYPNPSSDIFYLECETKTSISISDAIGRILFESELQAGEHTIDMGSQANGIYFLKCSSQNKTQVIKLIKE